MTAHYQARTVQALPAWGTAEAPPGEFRLFAFGETMTATWWGNKREKFVLTKEGANVIIQEWSRRNIEGAFDRDHDFGDSRGTFDIELRADGLWVSSIQWTAETLQKFAEKKLRYYSPAFDVTYDDNHEPVRDAEKRLQICSLLNIALTNYPATDNLRPLIALSQKRPHRRLTTMDIAAARSFAAKIAEYVGSKEYTVDGLALMLMEGETADPAAITEDPSAETDPMLEGAKAEEQMIASAAIAATGLKGRACVGALQQLGAVVKERDKAVMELRTIKHAAAVEQALKERKITPDQKADALKEDPELFRGSMKWARPVVDGETYTAKTAEPKEVKPADVITDEMRAWCASHNRDLAEYSAFWASRFPGVPFSAR